jgi:hypothetical protein
MYTATATRMKSKNKARPKAKAGAAPPPARMARTSRIDRANNSNYNKTVTAPQSRAPRKPQQSTTARAYNSMYGTAITTQAAINFFDASKSSNQGQAVSMPSSMGSFVTLNALARSAQPVLFATHPDVYVIYQYTPSNVSFFTLTSTNRQLIATVHTSWTESPESCRPSRATIALQNATNSQTADGSVSVLVTQNPLDFEFSNTTIGFSEPVVSPNFLAELASMTDTHPMTKNYTYKDFQSVKSFVISPSSQVNYNGWAEYINYSNMNGSLTGEALAVAKQNFLIAEAHKQRCTTLVIRFRATTVTNSYQIFGYNQIAARFASNSMLAKLNASTRFTITDAQYQQFTKMLAEGGTQQG